MTIGTGFAPQSGEYRRFIIGFVAAGTATFAQMYSPQGILPLIASDLQVSASASSFAVGAATLGVALGVIPWARMSDRFGRLWVMRVSMIAAVVIGFIVPLAPTFSSMIALRLIEGLFLAGLPAVALTVINEEIIPRAIGVAAGSYIAGNTFGGLIGRLIAAPAAEIGGWRLGMAAVSALALVATLVFLVVMPRAQNPMRMPRVERRSLGAQIRANFATPGVLLLLAQAFLLMGGFVAIYNYLAFRLEEPPYSLTPTLVSYLFIAYLAGTVSSPTVWRFTRSRTTTSVLIAAVVVTIAGALITLSSSVAVIMVGLVVMTAGFFAAHSIASGLLVRRATFGRSQAAPLYNVFYYAGSTVVGWLGGVAYMFSGWTGTVLMVAVLAACSVVATLWYARGNGGFAGVDAADAAASPEHPTRFEDEDTL